MLPPTIRENDLPFLPHVGAGVGAGVASRCNRGYKVSTSKRCERGVERGNVTQLREI